MSRGLKDMDGRVTMTLPLERVGMAMVENPDTNAEILRRDPPGATDSKFGADRKRS